jgi:excisionase family DNA binding protein
MTDSTGNVLVYRISAVAKLLGTTIPAVRRMIDNGEIPARRLGRRIVVLPEELWATLESLDAVGKTPTTPTPDTSVDEEKTR